MKNFSKLILLLNLFVPVWSLMADELVLNVQEIASRIKQNGLETAVAADRLYQAEQSVETARGDLLPKLNVWNLVRSLGGAATGDFIGLLDLVPDLAPFLFPKNWIRLEENELLYLSQKEATRTLWANQVLKAKGMYFKILYDQNLNQEMTATLLELQSIAKTNRAREFLGASHSGSTDEIEKKIILFKKGHRELQELIQEEIGQLTLALGISHDVSVTLSAVIVPPIQDLKPIKAGDLLPRVLDSASELREYEYLVKEAPLIEDEVFWAFLDNSTLTHGAAGGNFNHIPVPGGFGFATAPSIRIAKTEEKILKRQKEGSEQAIVRRLNELEKKYNNLAAAYKDAQSLVAINQKLITHHRTRFKLGDKGINFVELAEFTLDLVAAKTYLSEATYRYFLMHEQLNRILWQEDYQALPAALEEVLK